MSVGDSAAITFDSSISRLRAVERFAIGRRALSLIALGRLQPSLQANVLLPYFSADGDQANRFERLRDDLLVSGVEAEAAAPALDRVFSGVLIADVLQTPLLDQTVLLASEVLRKLDWELPLENFGQWFGDRLDRVVASGAVATDVGTPRGLTQLMVALADLGSAADIYDPACGLGGLLAAAYAQNPSLSLSGVDIHPFSWAMCSLRLHLLGATARIVLADALREDVPPNISDRVICDPPLGSYWAGDPDGLFDRISGREWRGKRLDSQFLDLCTHCLGPRGRAVILVSQTVLSRRGPEQEIRLELVREGLIEGVLSLPAGAVPWSNVDLALVILDRRKASADPIRFVDGSRMRLSGPHSRGAFDWVQVFELYRSAEHDRLVEVSSADVTGDASLWPKAYFPQVDGGQSVEEMLAKADELEDESRTLGQRIRRLLRRIPPNPLDAI